MGQFVAAGFRIDFLSIESSLVRFAAALRGARLVEGGFPRVSPSFATANSGFTLHPTDPGSASHPSVGTPAWAIIDCPHRGRGLGTGKVVSLHVRRNALGLSPQHKANFQLA
jgi:hypothetical protein